MGLGFWREVQIRSRQDCERGLRGGEICGNPRRRIGALTLTNGRFEGIDAIPEWVAILEEWLELGVSVIEP